jgi:hypothetical protein
MSITADYDAQSAAERELVLQQVFFGVSVAPQPLKADCSRFKPGTFYNSVTPTASRSPEDHRNDVPECRSDQRRRAARSARPDDIETGSGLAVAQAAESDDLTHSFVRLSTPGGSERCTTLGGEQERSITVSCSRRSRTQPGGTYCHRATLRRRGMSTPAAQQDAGVIKLARADLRTMKTWPTLTERFAGNPG